MDPQGSGILLTTCTTKMGNIYVLSCEESMGFNSGLIQLLLCRQPGLDGHITKLAKPGACKIKEIWRGCWK